MMHDFCVNGSISLKVRLHCVVASRPSHHCELFFDKRVSHFRLPYFVRLSHCTLHNPHPHRQRLHLQDIQSATMDRTTNIINDAEVAHAMAMSSQGKKQAKNRKKPTDGGAFSFKASKKPSGTITANKGAKTAANMIMSRGPRARFYEENGLKIPLYDNDGQGTRRRLHARLAKSLLNRSAENLLDIVEQYAGADKKQELRNKRLSKLKLATWIEEKETLALGRNPKSTLASKCRLHSLHHYT